MSDNPNSPRPSHRYDPDAPRPPTKRPSSIPRPSRKKARGAPMNFPISITRETGTIFDRATR